MSSEEFLADLAAVPTEGQNAEAYRIVGEYLQAFAFLESDVGDAIQTALGIEPLERIALVDLIPFSGKIAILMCLCNMHGPDEDEDEWKKSAIKLLGQIQGLGEADRNMLAHSMFFGSSEGGVDFYRSRARTKAERPLIRWTKQQAHQKIRNIFRLCREIQPMGPDLLKRKTRSEMLRAISKERTFFGGGLGALAGGGLLGNWDGLIQEPDGQ
ncbi:hypothetical protein [Microvirga brassicacearum]|uniref:Uncharacterized protein n=1 Tax=Microvirga brassicacearum TaxID=2580413 RepID=A0A5N3PH23_9HYPH|nr:hypothetical protein [Microvirga brassicacearum]KAB0269036.1 hypothetical protein FEZ63_02705 [Microvirga brassicacearum]